MRKVYYKKYKKYCKQLGITLEEGKESYQEILIDWKHRISMCTYLNLSNIPYLVIYNNENPENATKCCRLSLVSNEYMNIFPKSKMVNWKFTNTESSIISEILRNYWKDIIFRFGMQFIDVYGYCKYIPSECPYYDGNINIVENNHQIDNNLQLSDIQQSDFLSIISINLDKNQV